MTTNRSINAKPLCILNLIRAAPYLLVRSSQHLRRLSSNALRESLDVSIPIPHEYGVVRDNNDAVVKCHDNRLTGIGNDSTSRSRCDDLSPNGITPAFRADSI